MNKDASIFITGGSGMLGKALRSELAFLGYTNIYAPTRAELNLLDLESVSYYLKSIKPDYIFHLASLVYGLKGNMNNQMQSLVNNTKIYANLFEAISDSCQPKKIFFAGTVASYGYPYVSQPLREEDFFVGLPHSGEFGYAMAKRHAYSYLDVLYKSLNIPYVYGALTNLFGEHDTFNSDTGHVIPSLIKKAVFSRNNGLKTFEVWGNPRSARDFLYIKDAARIVVHLMGVDSGIYNISTGASISMGDLANIIASNLNNDVSPCWDSEQPVGISDRVVSNIKLLNSGFSNYTKFSTAIAQTINWYQKEIS